MASLTDQDLDQLMRFRTAVMGEPDARELLARARETILKARRGEHEGTPGGPGRTWKVRDVQFDPLEEGELGKRGAVKVIFEPPEG